MTFIEFSWSSEYCNMLRNSAEHIEAKTNWPKMADDILDAFVLIEQNLVSFICQQVNESRLLQGPFY